MKKNKKHLFIIVLSFIITFFSSIALNITDIQSKLNNIDYANYPSNYSVYNLLNIDNYEEFMKQNFLDFEYKKYYKSSDKITTNILSENLKTEVLGCESNFEKYPLPSCYSDSINFSKLKLGNSFNDLDILNNSNAIIMYEAHLKKIGFDSGDYILINGIRFYIKGILEDNADVIRNQSQNIIQVFIPYTTFKSIFKNINVKTVIQTNDYNFEYLNDDVNFISRYKVNQIISTNKEYLMSTSLPLLVVLFIISFVSTIIVQIIIIKDRYNEIGIRRAVGASREEIIYSFTKDTFLSTIFGMIIGIIMYFIVLTFFQLVLTMLYKSSFFIYNLNMVFIFVFTYAFISFFSILIPTFMGTNINISSILVEEK